MAGTASTPVDLSLHNHYASGPEPPQPLALASTVPKAETYRGSIKERGSGCKLERRSNSIKQLQPPLLPQSSVCSVSDTSFDAKIASEWIGPLDESRF